VDPSLLNVGSGSPLDFRRITRNSWSEVPTATILPSPWITRSSPVLLLPTRRSWMPSPLNEVSRVPSELSRMTASALTRSLSRVLVPTTVIFPLRTTTAFASSNRFGPAAMWTMPSPLNEWSSVPSVLIRTIANLLPPSPTATAFPSDWIATALAPPEMPTRSFPSPLNVESRSPAAATAGRARAAISRAVSRVAMAARRVFIGHLPGVRGPRC
jgi:hypothetical protein